MSCTSPAPWWRTPSKRRFDRRFGPLIFLTAPNQHRPLPDLRREPGNIGPSPLPAVSSHIHSKTACREFESYCPCQKNQVSQLRYLIFFVSVRNVLATRRGCAPRSACRGASERQWRSAANRPRRQPRPSPCAPAKKPAKTLGFRRFSFCMCCMVMWFTLVQTLAFSIRFYPFSTVLIPSSTQNAPGFALFGRFRVRFSLFRCFLAAKFSPWFLCNLPHSVYKLKPSVIPCRREVSFLT